MRPLRNVLAMLSGTRRLAVRELDLAPPGWPAALDGLRAAVVADVHAGAPGVRVSRVLDLVTGAAPDLILLLGDYVDPTVRGGRRVSPADVARRLAALRAPLGVFAVLGNHDWVHTAGGMRDALLATGMRVLEDEAVRIDAAGGPLWVAGLAELEGRDPRPGAALAGVPAGEPLLVLAHDPDLFPYVPARASLTIAGHTHGGQVDLPWLRTLAMGSRYGDRYKAGHVVEGGRHLFVSRGIGTARVPLRVGARPELPVLRLRAAAAG